LLTYFTTGARGEDLLSRQASEQYLMDSQFLAQDFRHVISLPQVMHNLLCKKDLFPLNPDFSDLLIPTYLKTNRLLNTIKKWD
jgi:hypothetical protein